MLGSPILYLKAMRILMFQLSGFYCNGPQPPILIIKAPIFLNGRALGFRAEAIQAATSTTLRGN